MKVIVNSYYLAQLLGLLMLTFGTSILAEEKLNLQQNNNKTLMVFGDSLSAAYNIRREQGWVYLLQNSSEIEQRGIKVINASISGETTGGGLTRLAKLLELNTPQWVLIELGGNDGLRGFQPSTTEANLRAMIKLCQDSGAQVIVAEIKIPPNLGRTYTRLFSGIFETLSKLPRVSVMPFLLQKVADTPELMQVDRIHPTAEAQPQIKQNVLGHLLNLEEISSLPLITNY